MINKLAVAAITGAAAVATLAVAAPAQADDMRFGGGKCSLRTLHGAYSGNISGTSTSGPFNFQATNVFDGKGHGEGIRVIRADESGVTDYTAELTYTLASDCTGSLTAQRSTGVTTHYVIVVTGGGSKVWMLETDQGYVANGTTERVSKHG